MSIRPATSQDLSALYELGLSTPQIQVSANDPFMEKDEFMDTLNRPEYFLFVAEENSHIEGFLMGYWRKEDLQYKNAYGCIVYLVVKSEYRGSGLAKQLYDQTETMLRKNGVTNLYSWANLNSGIIPFLEKQGFQKGHQYVWMDKKLT